MGCDVIETAPVKEKEGIILRIDRQEVKAEEGQSILDAALKAGIYIPALLDALPP